MPADERLLEALHAEISNLARHTLIGEHDAPPPGKVYTILSPERVQMKTLPGRTNFSAISPRTLEENGV
jgi:hypothetical protein